MLGNVTVSLLHGASCAVAIAPSGYRDAGSDSISTAVVGDDGSPEARLALESAAELSRATGARLRIVAAAEPPPIVYGKSGGTSGAWAAIKEDVEDALREKLEEAAGSVSGDVDVDAQVVSGAPADALAREARSPGSILSSVRAGMAPSAGCCSAPFRARSPGWRPAPVVVDPRGSDAGLETTEAAEAGTVA